MVRVADLVGTPRGDLLARGTVYILPPDIDMLCPADTEILNPDVHCSGEARGAVPAARPHHCPAPTGWSPQLQSPDLEYGVIAERTREGGSALHTDVAVVGAGISGLAMAHFLKQCGVRATVLEREQRAGGSIRTVCRNGFLFEPGPNSVLDTSEAMRQLIDEVGLTESVEYASEAATNRYIVRHGRLMALPASPPAFVRTRLFSARAKLRLLREPFIRPAPLGAGIPRLRHRPLCGRHLRRRT